MAGGKETPRQKMIGLMYLVLMALLAMNVSKEVLNSFVTINEGLEHTNANFEGKNEYTYNAFEKANINDPKKVGPYLAQAKQVKLWCNDLDSYIDKLKRELMKQTDGLPDAIADTMHLKYVNSKDNYDFATGILIGEPANPKDGEFTAKDLRARINKLNEDLHGLFPEDKREGIHLGLETKDPGLVEGVPETWETNIFYHVPLAAVITALSKIQSDVRNAEADVIKMLYSNISADDFKFDTLAAKVIPNTNYVILGDSYKAEVFVAAFSSTQNPKMVLGEVDTTTMEVKNGDSTGVRYKRGVAIYATAPRSEGVVEWGGVIKIKKPDGTYQPYPFKSAYTAAKPALVVAPTAMNVFYRGLENPVEISVPGISTDKLQVSVSNASKTGSNGKFMIKPGTGNECEVSASAELNGKNQSFGKMKFRVKNVPDPKAQFAGMSGGDVQRSAVLAAPGVLAKMENFEFDLKFQIISYTLSATIKGAIAEAACTGAALTGDQKTILQNLKSGQKFYLEKIKAKGPDGTVRDLGTLSYKVL